DDHARHVLPPRRRSGVPRGRVPLAHAEPPGGGPAALGDHAGQGVRLHHLAHRARRAVERLHLRVPRDPADDVRPAALGVHSRRTGIALPTLWSFFTFVLLEMLQTPQALPIAVFTGVVSQFVPTIGNYLGGALPVAVALTSQGLPQALGVLGFVIGYQQLEN